MKLSVNKIQQIQKWRQHSTCVNNSINVSLIGVQRHKSVYIIFHVKSTQCSTEFAFPTFSITMCFVPCKCLSFCFSLFCIGFSIYRHLLFPSLSIHPLTESLAPLCCNVCPGCSFSRDFLMSLLTLYILLFSLQCVAYSALPGGVWGKGKQQNEITSMTSLLSENKK